MVNSPPGRKRIPAGDSTEARLSVTRVISFAFGSRQMSGVICIACRLSSGGVTRIAAAKGGFLKRSVTIIHIAERAGVAFQTVSSVLLGASHVAADTPATVEGRVRVLDIHSTRAAALLRRGNALAR